MAGPLKKGLSNILKKSPDDIVILSSLRTPITRSYKGGLKDAYPEELLSTVRDNAPHGILEVNCQLTTSGPPRHTSREPKP
jgi:hypothetical protein